MQFDFRYIFSILRNMCLLENECCFCLREKPDVFSMNCGHMVCEDCVEIMMTHYVKDLYCIYCHRQTELVNKQSSVLFDLWNFLWNIYTYIVRYAK